MSLSPQKSLSKQQRKIGEGKTFEMLLPCKEEAKLDFLHRDLFMHYFLCISYETGAGPIFSSAELRVGLDLLKNYQSLKKPQPVKVIFYTSLSTIIAILLSSVHDD